MKKIPLNEVSEIKDLREMLQQSVEQYGDKKAFMIKKKIGVGEPYTEVTYKQYADDVDAFGTALVDLMGVGKRVAILAETRYEWYVTYLSTTNGAGIVVPLDKELPAKEIMSLLNRSKTDCLVYSAEKQSVVDQIIKDLKTVKHFVCMDDKNIKKPAVSFWKLLNSGKKLLAKGDRRFLDAPINPEEMTILLFTSGTTAQSKAVMLSQKNIASNLMGMRAMAKLYTDDVALSVLPLHHTYECTCGFLCMINSGACVAQCEGLRYITQNMKEAEATIILAVPLLLEAFHRAIMKKAKADPKSAKKFNFGIKLTRGLRKIGIDKRKKIFKPVHDNFGGKLRLLISGGAGIDAQILTDLQDMGLECFQGYGLTETAPILALNRDVDFNNRAAGLPLPGVDVKIIDKDENGIGEIIGRGPNVMLGYYENEEATKEAIDEDGYFHTGDLGYIDNDGFVIITGRKKNVIISKNGKNIFPEEIEFILAKSPYIKESLVSGEDSAREDTVVCASIFPDEDAIREALGEKPNKDAIKKLIEDEVKKANEELVSYKQVRKVILRDAEFEKTTSKKIKRTYN